MALPEIQDLPRSIALEGASNLRDIGGWPTADGGRVRFGRVYRSAALSMLTEADVAVLRPLGIRHVVDLRGGREAEAAPSLLDGLDVTRHALSIEPSIGASLRDLRETSEYTGENVMALLGRAYVAYAMDWSHRYRDLFALLLQPDGCPLLFHCSAGKDRTGFGAALLLRTLGVPSEQVRQDYVATNSLWRSDPALAAELPPDVAAVMLRAHPEWIEAAFAAIDAEFGDFKNYLEQRIGLDAQALQSLRRRLVE